MIKSLPLAVLVLPLVAGCGKSGPVLSKKGSAVTNKVFVEAYAVAQKAAKWNIEGSVFEGGKATSKTVYKSKTVHKRGSKLLGKTKTESKSEKVYKFDSSNHVATYKSKDKSEEKSKGVGIKKDIEKSKTVEKTGVESYSNILEGSLYGLASFNYVSKDYEVLSSFSSPLELDSSFQRYIKNEISGLFAIPNISSIGYMTDSSEELVNYKFYVNGNIFTYIYEKLDTYGIDTTQGMASGTSKTIKKVQLNLNPGKYKYEYFESTESNISFLQACTLQNVDFAAGDVYKVSSTSHTVTKGKEKKMHIGTTKTSKYKNITKNTSPYYPYPSL